MRMISTKNGITQTMRHLIGALILEHRIIGIRMRPLTHPRN